MVNFKTGWLCFYATNNIQQVNKYNKIHLFVVHVGEIHPIHFHNLVSNLHGDVRHTSRYEASGHQRFIEKFWSFLCCHLKSDFSREGAWFDITDVDTRFLGGTTGDADAHALGAYQAEEHLLLLDFFASDWGQACNAAFFLLRRVREKSKLHTLLVAMMQNPRKEGKSVTVSHPRLRHKLVHKLPLQRFVWRAAAMHKSKWEHSDLCTGISLHYSLLHYLFTGIIPTSAQRERNVLKIKKRLIQPMTIIQFHAHLSQLTLTYAWLWRTRSS